MPKKMLWAVLAVTLAAVLIGAGALYKKLSVNTEPGISQTRAVETAAESFSAAEPPTDSLPQTVQSTLVTQSATEPTTQTDKETAPDMTVLDMDGNTVSLSSHFGKPMVVNFWATWCGPCRDELPRFDAAAKKYAGQIDFMMINLTDGYRDTIDGVKAFVQESGYTFPIYFDTQDNAANAYGAISIPLTVFICSDGTILHTFLGSMPESLLGQYLAELL